MLSIVLLNYNTKELTINCLNSIFDNPPSTEYKVVLVDNASADGSVDEVKKMFKNIKVIQNKKNLGFSAGNNIGLKSIDSDYYLLINSDTLVQKDSLDNMLKFMESHLEFGVISCKLLNPDRSFQPNAGQLPNPINTFLWVSNLDIVSTNAYQARSKSYYKNGREVGWVSGAVMLIKDEVLKKAGYLDEGIFMYGEDVEFCMRVKKNGFRVGWTDTAEVIHIGGASSKSPRFRQWLGEFRGLLYIYNKYYGNIISIMMRCVFYVFILFRALVFTLMGNLNFGRTYAKVVINL